MGLPCGRSTLPLLYLVLHKTLPRTSTVSRWFSGSLCRPQSPLKISSSKTLGRSITFTLVELPDELFKVDPVFRNLLLAVLIQNHLLQSSFTRPSSPRRHRAALLAAEDIKSRNLCRCGQLMLYKVTRIVVEKLLLTSTWEVTPTNGAVTINPPAKHYKNF